MWGLPSEQPKPKIKNGHFQMESMFTDFEITNLREIVSSLGKRGYMEETPLHHGGYKVKLVLDSKDYYEYILFEMNKIKKKQDEFKKIMNGQNKIQCEPDIDWSQYDRLRYNGDGFMY